ncbi:hypothetical protein SDRG_00774 [Saprolegnia diclina VS20]|uniref:Uncharacterized protein n=1 Tax=Saprolegnia diclina (strain VS20) TaxID=1156394 RepID=T0QUN6_SAPDV|nr:hypothetical protein SDRG_00774 [Saprolegnia diclina VS20]EQC41919.1 hypothetical protein SDRG_00774 [Saprolegnia diclina VS20]|eukprot:XP_008604488.1 hypothetical protein SDRG_00774 [Saprolegnia diclina VS20]
MARDATVTIDAVHRRSVSNNNYEGRKSIRKSVVAPEAAHEPHYDDKADSMVGNPEVDAPEESSPPPIKYRPSYSRPYDLPPPKAPLPKAIQGLGPRRVVATSEKSSTDDDGPRTIVNAHSRTLLELKRRKPSLVDPSLKVEDRLQQLGLVYAQKQASKQAINATHQCTFTPAISYHSSKLSRHGSVHDRLYGLAKAPTRAPDAASTTASPAKPATSNTATSAGERLYRKAREFQVKQDAVRAAEAAEAASLRNARKMSAKSLRLVERSTKPPQPVPTSASSPPARTKQVTTAQARAIYDRQLQWKEAKDARSARIRWQQDRDEQQACTFQNPYADMATPPLHDASFFDKAIEWAKAKDAVVRQKQQARQAEELAACPFKPQRPPRPRRRDPSGLEAIIATFQAVLSLV